MSDLEAFEREMHALFAAAECETLAQELTCLDVDVPVILVEGIAHRRVVRCEETYFGAAGPVRIMRSLYSTRQDGERAVCPMGLRGGFEHRALLAAEPKEIVLFAVNHRGTVRL